MKPVAIKRYRRDLQFWRVGVFFFHIHKWPESSNGRFTTIVEGTTTVDVRVHARQNSNNTITKPAMPAASERHHVLHPQIRYDGHMSQDRPWQRILQFVRPNASTGRDVMATWAKIVHGKEFSNSYVNSITAASSPIIHKAYCSWNFSRPRLSRCLFNLLLLLLLLLLMLLNIFDIIVDSASPDCGSKRAMNVVVISKGMTRPAPFSRSTSHVPVSTLQSRMPNKPSQRDAAASTLASEAASA